MVIFRIPQTFRILNPPIFFFVSESVQMAIKIECVIKKEVTCSFALTISYFDFPSCFLKIRTIEQGSGSECPFGLIFGPSEYIRGKGPMH